MATKNKTKTKTKKKPSTNLKFTVSVDWHGDYFENRDALCDLFPKYESGSGVGISGNDCSFSDIPGNQLIRVISKIREFCKKRESVKTNMFYNLEYHWD